MAGAAGVFVCSTAGGSAGADSAGSECTGAAVAGCMETVGGGVPEETGSGALLGMHGPGPANLTCLSLKKAHASLSAVKCTKLRASREKRVRCGNPGFAVGRVGGSRRQSR